MKVGCVRCNKVFESLVIEPETAWKDIFTEVTKHLKKEHPKFFSRVQESSSKSAQSIFSYVIITETTRSVEENKWLDERLDSTRDIIMRSIGYEAVEDEDEEIEEVEEEIEEENNKEEEETPVFESD